MLIKMIIKNALRHKLRSILTLLGIAVAISAFGFMRTVITAWYAGVETSAANRIVSRNAVSLVFPLPLAYKEKIKKIPHVTGVTYSNWFGGIYKDPSNFFPQFAVEAETFFELYPEYLLEPGVLDGFKRERNAVIVGRNTAERFGWKVGDNIRLIGTIYPGDWDFVIKGIFKGRDLNTDESSFIFSWDYLNERLNQVSPGRANRVGTYIMTIDDPNLAASVSTMVDETFDNSLAETLTETESAFQLSFVSMSSAIITGIQIVSFVIILIILLVLVNTMVMSARERMSEYAVIKTLGFRTGFVFRLIAGEALLIAVLGGGLGIFFMIPMVEGFAKNVGQFFQSFALTDGTLVLAACSAVAVGLIASLPPVTRAVRTSIIDSLREIG